MRLGRPIPGPTSTQALALRDRVILACAAGKTNTQVSAEMRLSKPAVGKWRSRFVARRLDGRPTIVQSPLFGPKPPTKFWPASPAFVNESLIQDTSGGMSLSTVGR